MNISDQLIGTFSNVVREREHDATTGRFNSVYRGIVENVADPLILGRVQVRVPALHGINNGKREEVSDSNKFIPTYDLAWAHVLTTGGGSFDRGSSIPMASGAMVLVVFEGGSIYAPIVIGTFHCFPNVQVPLNTDPWGELPKYKKVPMGIGVRNHSEPTTPTEACLTWRQSQTRFVIQKSLKGHTIWGEDRDDDECFEMVDRNGQGIRMEGFISVDDNAENECRRKTRSAFARCAVPESPISRVLVKEVGNNSVTMESYEGEKKLRIGSGKSRLELDGVRDITHLGNMIGGQFVEIDSEVDVVRLKASTIVLDADEIVVKGNTRFYNMVEVLENLYSFRRFIVNEVNDNKPRSVTTRKS